MAFNLGKKCTLGKVMPANPLLESDLIDSLRNIENHLRFINDYFAAKQADSDSTDDVRVLHGLCKTLDMTIDAIAFCRQQEESKVT